MHRIEIIRRDDRRANSVLEDFLAFGIRKIKKIDIRDVYYLDENLPLKAVHLIARELLCDPVYERYRIGPGTGFEILYNPGVTDPKEDSIKKAIHDLGIRISGVHTATNYIIKGVSDTQSLQKIKKAASLFLYNPLIQHIKYREGDTHRHRKYKLRILNVSLNQDLQKLSDDMGLSLSLVEMMTIKKYFSNLGRRPTDVELETIAQTWSEHCVHKTFRGKILYKGKVINNLLKNTIMKATKEINHPMCLSVFHDNSGVIDFDKTYGVCFKVETHNHPSALEPYGGAATGIGGVIRDILGTGLGAKPIMNTDVFCFGPPEYDYRKLPEGILHPRRIIKGVYQGVRDYGNRMGIPTPSGAIYFDEDFLYNPLVYCGTVGIIRKDRINKKAHRGDAIILVGGKTGRDGIHGATFSSVELSSESEKSCVQIGNPIMEKRVLDCLIKLNEQGIINSVTDCGGGGLSSAVGEMGKDIGAKVLLDKVPLKYQGLSPREIWISESQERMILSICKENLRKVIREFSKENVEASVIGSFTGDKQLRLYYNKKEVCSLEMDFLHNRIPMPTKKARVKTESQPAGTLPKPNNYNKTLLALIGSLNCSSREWVVREYDHEVQGASVIKPFCGINHDGPQDATVIKPRLDSNKGIAVSCGINPSYGRLDAYRMALSVIDEALRNIVAVGGDIHKTALLDNFCFSSPSRPEVLGDIVLSSYGCYDAAKAFGVPFISGKDSLNNEWMDNKGMSHQIPATLLISAIGVIDNIRQCITMDFKNEHSDVYLVGETKEELGGSEYLRLLEIKDGKVPSVDLAKAPRIMKALHRAITSGLVLSCHDLSEGGLATAISEMAFSGNIGVQVDLNEILFKGKNNRPDYLLFAESNSRFLIEIESGKQKKLLAIFKKLPIRKIGFTTYNKSVVFKKNNQTLIDLSLDVLKNKWKRIR